MSVLAWFMGRLSQSFSSCSIRPKPPWSASQSATAKISIIAVDPKALRTGISAYRMTDVIPCTYDMNTRRLVIGSTAAIKQAGRAP
ncbi:MAG: hypothetical protein WDN48_06300 [Pseudolabrys sp.]